MKQQRTFWGWYIVFGSLFLMAINYGARYCFGIFVKPMSLEYGWSRAVISLAVSIHLFVYAAGAIYVGRYLDRFGPRRIVLIGSLCYAAGFILSGFAHDPLQFYLVYGFVCGLGSAATGVVVCNPYVGKWFEKRRGLALGISSTGIGLGTVLLSPLAGFIVKEYGWQNGFFFLGIMIVVGGVTIAEVVMHRATPEDCGLLPDGATGPGNAPHGKGHTAEMGQIRWTEICRDTRFWVLTMAHGMAVMAFLTIIMHQVAYAMDNGIEKITAASSLGMVSMFGIFGQFLFGWFSDRVRDPKFAASLGYLIMAIGMILLLRVSDAGMLFFFAAFFGFGYGSLAPVLPVMTADRFGRRVMGSVYGLLTFFTVGVIGSAGPLLGGVIFDATGSYRLVWKFNFCILFLAAILILVLKRDGQHGRR